MHLHICFIKMKFNFIMVIGHHSRKFWNATVAVHYFIQQWPLNQSHMVGPRPMQLPKNRLRLLRDSDTAIK